MAKQYKFDKYKCERSGLSDIAFRQFGFLLAVKSDRITSISMILQRYDDVLGKFRESGMGDKYCDIE